MDATIDMRRVDWSILINSRVPAATACSSRGGVVSVLSAIDELSCYTSLDTILRRAVELLRDRIGLERVGLFLLNPDDQLMHGTWGTGLVGETTDEHQIAFAMGENHQEAFRRAESDRSRWLLLNEAPRTVQIEGVTRVMENGWIVLTPIISARGPIGLLASDGAISQAPMIEAMQTQAAVFCSLLANLIELRRQEATSTCPRPAFRARHPKAIARTELISRAVELIRREPTLGRLQLAQRLGTTGARLGKLFKAELSFSVTEYRNRLRLETFLGLVERGGANLLEASMEAGFGSYAQFHRVFRGLLDATPREYLTGKGEWSCEKRDRSHLLMKDPLFDPNNEKDSRHIKTTPIAP